MRIALPPRLDPAALATHDPDAIVVTLDGTTMGTGWTVRYAAPSAHDAEPVRHAIEARLADLVAQMSHWEPESALCRFNHVPAGRTIDLPADFAAVIDLSLRIAAASGGAFDPTIGHLVDRWGFGPPGPMPVPDAAAIEAARAASGWRRLRYDSTGRRLRQPGGLALDLSGVAKGYAADALADLLAEQGIRHCLTEVGGELAGRGVRPDGDPWWVDLETPPGIVLPPLRVALHQCAVATTGTYRKGDHSIDPRTGRPADNGVIAVSVVASSAALADALATALAVGYPDTMLIDRMGIAARLILRTPDGVREVVTPALAAMMA